MFKKTEKKLNIQKCKKIFCCYNLKNTSLFCSFVKKVDNHVTRYLVKKIL